MADYYVGTVQHAAVQQWAANTAYAVGTLRRQLATPAQGSERVFRVTVAGTSGATEPTWNTGSNGATTSDNGVTWQEVTGLSTYGWAAAGANLNHMVSSKSGQNDRVFVASDHYEVRNASYTFSALTTSGLIRIISVNAGGSVPPVGADYQPGATIACANGFNITFVGQHHFQGIRFRPGNLGASNTGIAFNNNGGATMLDGCTIEAGGSCTAQLTASTQNRGYCVVRDTTFKFATAGSAIVTYGYVRLSNITNDTSVVVPNYFVSVAGTCVVENTDLSMFSGKPLCSNTSSVLTFINCKLPASIAAFTPNSPSQFNGNSNVTCIGCDFGDDLGRVIRLDSVSTEVSERTVVKTGGSFDEKGGFSQKVVTSAAATLGYAAQVLPMVVENATIGVPITLTVDLLTAGNVALTDQHIWMEAFYLGTAGSAATSRVTNLAGGAQLDAGVSHPASSATWTTTGVTLPVAQKMSVTFTPQVVGPIRVCLYVARPSTTVYIDANLDLS